MVIRYDEKTPSGADYFEMFYCDEDGSILNKTWGYLKRKYELEEENKKKAKL